MDYPFLCSGGLLNWKQRASKLLSVFFTGYGGGFGVSVPANYIYAPHEVNWIGVFLLPTIAGLLMTWPQIGKMFGEMANGD